MAQQDLFLEGKIVLENQEMASVAQSYVLFSLILPVARLSEGRALPSGQRLAALTRGQPTCGCTPLWLGVAGRLHLWLYHQGARGFCRGLGEGRQVRKK